MKYKNPHGSNIVYKSSHMMDSSLCIHSEGYTRGRTQIFWATLDAKSIWDLVFLPKRQECNWVQLGANGCKWVYKVKHNGDGLVSRYKTKLITKAYAQTYDIDYEENYSSIVKMTIIRTMIVMATIKWWS